MLLREAMKSQKGLPSVGWRGNDMVKMYFTSVTDDVFSNEYVKETCLK